MKTEQEILNNFINSIVSSLSDEEVKNLKLYAPTTAQLICALISDYFEGIPNDNKKVEKIFIKSFINKLI